jgi:hypothetical protein
VSRECHIGFKINELLPRSPHCRAAQSKPARIRFD